MVFGIARGLIVLTRTKSESRMREILAAESVVLDSIYGHDSAEGTGQEPTLCVREVHAESRREHG